LIKKNFFKSNFFLGEKLLNLFFIIQLWKFLFCLFIKYKQRLNISISQTIHWELQTVKWLITILFIKYLSIQWSISLYIIFFLLSFTFQKTSHKRSLTLFSHQMIDELLMIFISIIILFSTKNSAYSVFNIWFSDSLTATCQTIIWIWKKNLL
jgi:heme/copper-type cytochrome/quinol oxidase subunit 2